MVSLKTKPHLSLRKYLAQYKPQSLQRTLKINDKGNKLVKLSTKQTDRNKLIFHFFFKWISFHSRKNWKYTSENANERNFSGAERALFRWGFLIGWGFCLLLLALLLVCFNLDKVVKRFSHAGAIISELSLLLLLFG